MTKLKIVPWTMGDRQYFEDEEAYQDYIKREKELQRIPEKLEFEWKYLLKLLLFGEKHADRN